MSGSEEKPSPGEAWKLSKEKFRTMADFTYDWELWEAPDGKLIYSSPSCENITGYLPEDFINNPNLIINIIHPEDQLAVRDHFQKLNHGKPHVVDFRIINRSGDVRWIAHRCVPVFGNDGQWLGRRASNRDITDRKRMEEELAKARDELEIRVQERTAELVKTNEELQLKAIILDRATDAILLRDINHNLIYVNEAAAQIYGYSKDELTGINLQVLVWPGSLAHYEEKTKELTEKGSIRTEALHVRKDKSVFPVYINAHRIKIGQREYFLSVINDITDRKHTEEALRISEEKYRSVVENSSDVIAVAQDGILKFFNPKLLRTTGYSIKEINSISFLDIIHPDDRDLVAERHRRRIRGEAVPATYEIRVIRKDGSIRWAQMNCVLITWEKRPAVLNIINDITEQKQLRDEKDQFTRKLIEVQEEERKRISRELHDETAQYLTLLALEMDTLILKIEKSSPKIASDLKELKANAEKALREVRRYSHELRPGVLEHFGLPEALRLIIGEFNERSHFKVGFKLRGEVTRLKEAVEITFFRIAQEALSNIRKHSEASKAEIHLGYTPEKVRLTITDDGRGFDASKKRIAGSQGGLGLVGMRERANLIGGTLKINSKVDKGTTISIEVLNRDNNLQ